MDHCAHFVGLTTQWDETHIVQNPSVPFRLLVNGSAVVAASARACGFKLKVGSPVACITFQDSAAS